MGLFRRRPKITAGELARSLCEQIVRPSDDVRRSFHVTAQKMQPRAKRDVSGIALELYFLRAYLMIGASRRAFDGAAHDAHRRLVALVEADTDFWREYGSRARAYDDAAARCAPGIEPDLALMAAFQEQLGNPDPDTLLIGLRAWHQFSDKTNELFRYLTRLRVTGEPA